MLLKQGSQITKEKNTIFRCNHERYVTTVGWACFRINCTDPFLFGNTRDRGVCTEYIMKQDLQVHTTHARLLCLCFVYTLPVYQQYHYVIVQHFIPIRLC